MGAAAIYISQCTRWTASASLRHNFCCSAPISKNSTVFELSRRGASASTWRIHGVLYFLGPPPGASSPWPQRLGGGGPAPPSAAPGREGGLRVLFGVPSTVRSSESLLLPDLRFLTTKDGLHKPPPLATRFSVTQIAKAVKAAYLGGVLRPQKPTSTGAPPIHVPLQRRDPPSAPPCCLPELRANLSDMPNEGRQPS